MTHASQRMSGPLLLLLLCCIAACNSATGTDRVSASVTGHWVGGHAATVDSFDIVLTQLPDSTLTGWGRFFTPPFAYRISGRMTSRGSVTFRMVDTVLVEPPLDFDGAPTADSRLLIGTLVQGLAAPYTWTRVP